MTGSTQMQMAAGSALAVGVLVAGTTNPFIGYLSGEYGSWSGGLLKGATIYWMLDDTGANRFQVRLAGSFLQNFFSSVTINGITYNTASVQTFNDSAGFTTWLWAGQANMVVGNSYTVRFA